MHLRLAFTLPILATVTLTALGCSDESKQATGESTCKRGTTQGCKSGQTCEDVDDGTVACFAPLSIVGKVTNALDGLAVEGALVVARDANGAAVSGTAATDAAGKYTLVVPVKRDADGNPSAGISYFMRADAAGYQSFPTAPRIALPVEMSKPTAGTIESVATSITLLPRSSSAATGTISGTVEIDTPARTLVVAGSATALVAADGTFTLFNIPVGTVTVSAYHQGFNVTPETVTVSADSTTASVKLKATTKPTASVSGKVAIVNPGGGTDTSVILVVADTFVENASRGEAPPGLRVGHVSGDFAISGVPDGKYVVLAAFENDLLVRDPDTCIGGTAFVSVTVAGSDVALSDSFKITGALDIVSPDREQIVSGTPNFVWADDSSEDHYTIAVYDAFGTLVWEDAQVPSVSGSKNVTVQYAGPSLTSGMIYQYRATSIRKNNCPISRTEDLRGTFKFQ